MDSEYKLIEPDTGIIDQYCSWRTDASDYCVELFQRKPKIDIRTLYTQQEIKKWADADNRINGYVRAKDVGGLLKTVNSAYSTRLDTDAIANNLTWDMLIEYSVDEFVSLCKKTTGKYAYSFATKVFSFIKSEDEFPIFDSYVVTLLDYYLTSKLGEKRKQFKKSTWGDYECFKAAYNEFKNQYHLQYRKYKEIDIFLWMYGTLIQRYWKKSGVLAFSSVPYKT